MMTSLNKRSKQMALLSIAEIVQKNRLTEKDIHDYLKTYSAQKHTDTLMKLLSYFGGIFIFAGIAIYVGMFWTSMTIYTKISLTLGTGLILYILAFILPAFDEKNESMIAPLLITSAIFQPIGLFIAIHEFATDSDIRLPALLVFGALMIQQFLTFCYLRRASLIFTTLLFGSAFIAIGLDLMNFSESFVGIALGFVLLLISYALDRSHYKMLSVFWYFIGALLFLNSLFDILRNTNLEFIFFLASCLILYLSTLVKNRMLLFISTLSVLGYIGYFTHKHFMHSTAWPVALVLLGLICFGVGMVALKLSRKYT